MEAKEFWPSLLEPPALDKLSAVIQSANGSDPLSLSAQLRCLAETTESEGGSGDEVNSLRLVVAASVLADLSEQGWDVRVENGKMLIQPPEPTVAPGEDVGKVKARIRNGLLMASDRQLATKSVQDFIRYMERDRSHRDEVVSIGTLVDDGSELADKLGAIAQLRPENRTKALGRLIRPVIQVCEPDAVCEYTGLKLLDIWRYFRHTWTLEYNPLPGRTIRVLIRNKARRNWPIIGIAMLASPAANLYVRDEWIGWRVDDLISRVLDGSWDAAHVAKKLVRTLKDAIADIRTDDLLSPQEIENPDSVVIFRLQQVAARADVARRRDLVARGTNAKSIVDIRCLDKENVSEEDWRRLSETSLYIKKRAEQLIPLLRTLKYFKDAEFTKAPAAALYEALVTKRGNEAVSLALNEIRKRKLATEVADLSVCGAIAPYNHILGGKLVALLVTSQEVRRLYSDRYSNQPSEIASQMAGRPIIRSANLKVLTTTSLYGVGSSQYNRLRLRAGTVPQLRSDLVWEELSPTLGFTVTHLSKLTVEFMRQLGLAVYGRRRINSVFGEGSSPRTRQVREGLNLIGINNDDVLRQGVGRRVYACELYPGARDALVGLAKSVRRQTSPSVAAITRAWLERWVGHRIARPEILRRVQECDGLSLKKELQDRANRARLEEPRRPFAAGDQSVAQLPAPVTAMDASQ